MAKYTYKCLPVEPDFEEYNRVRDHAWLEKAQNQDAGNTIYIKIRYVVLYNGSSQKVSLSRIRDCHRTNNMIFNGENTSEIAKIPDTQRNPWKSLYANPKIQFLPLDPNEVEAEYIPTSSDLSSNVPIDDAIFRGGVTPNVLNVYIGQTTGGNILGQAYVGSNTAYVLTSTVGGFLVPGTSANYGTGKTLVHEIGHCFSLLHTFSTASCNGSKPFADLPEQIEPNFYSEVFHDGDKWDARKCNRYYERISGNTSFSCLSHEQNPSTAPDENGINIMDYAIDPHKLMFSAAQVTMMRNWLMNTNTSMTLHDAPSGGSGGSGDESTVPWIVFAVVTLVAFLAIALEGYFLYKNVKIGSKGGTKSHTQKRRS